MPATPELLHVFPSFVPAGSQVRTAQLIRAFGEEFRHSILALDGRTEARELLEGVANVRFLPAPPKAGTPATAWRLRKLLQRERPDLLLTYNFGAVDALLAARLAGGWRAVHHEDGFGPDEARAFKRRRIWMRRALFPAARKVVVISETLRKVALEHWNESPLHLRFIANGIDVDRHAPRDGNEPLRRELAIGPSAFVVGAVGHLRPEKNLPRLLAAATRAVRDADVHVVILGDGPERAELEKHAQAQALRGRVHLVGHQADPRPFYRMFDAFALTSDTEQMPLSLLEAMATHLPAIATNVGDVVAMLPGEQAPFIALPGGASCVEALAASISRLAADRELQKRIGDLNARRARQHYSQRAMIDAYREVYREALA
ncbi:MAG TPA: glycosyltransferase [Planctomycetota bacterium]|nr:glycosyltransferase [Planctomycetota bacterium]